MIIAWSYRPGLFWVRVFGWGVLVKDVVRWPLIFSQRHGYAGARFGRLFVQWLPRWP